MKLMILKITPAFSLGTICFVQKIRYAAGNRKIGGGHEILIGRCARLSIASANRTNFGLPRSLTYVPISKSGRVENLLDVLKKYVIAIL
jgi:hypothetical protein